jgi:hypothetical protein
MLYITSGFWPRVRALALRAPVFLGSLPNGRGLALRAPVFLGSLPNGALRAPPPPIAASQLFLKVRTRPPGE